eukprot:4800901-Pyramimonas_sp.AAC.1
MAIMKGVQSHVWQDLSDLYCLTVSVTLAVCQTDDTRRHEGCTESQVSPTRCPTSGLVPPADRQPHS